MYRWAVWLEDREVGGQLLNGKCFHMGESGVPRSVKRFSEGCGVVQKGCSEAKNRVQHLCAV
jgi:hypothetical protein